MAISQEDKSFRDVVALCFGAALIIVVMVIVKVWDTSEITSFFGISLTWNTGMMLAIFLVAYIASGFGILDPHEQGVVVLLGRAIDNVGSGPYWVPRFIGRMEAVPAEQVQTEVPGDPTKIHRVKDGEPEVIPEGSDKVLPVRVAFRSPTEDGKYKVNLHKRNAAGNTVEEPVTFEVDKNDPYNKAGTHEASGTLEWSVEDPIAFIKKMRSLARGEMMLIDAVRSIMARQYQTVTPAVVNQNTGSYGLSIALELEKLTVGWGIKIDMFRPQAVGFNRSFNASVVGIATAEADAKASVETAEGDKKVAELKAEGEAYATRIKENALTKALTSRMEKLGVTGEQVLGAEVAETIMRESKAPVVVGVQGFKDLLGITKIMEGGKS